MPLVSARIPWQGATQHSARVVHVAEVLELVRVDDSHYGPNLLSRDVERHHANQLSIVVEQESTRLAVYLSRAHRGSGDLDALSHPSNNCACDAAATDKRSDDRGRLPATIGAQFHVMGK
jgi:hypothetical protein